MTDNRLQTDDKPKTRSRMMGCAWCGKPLPDEYLASYCLESDGEYGPYCNDKCLESDCDPTG